MRFSEIEIRHGEDRDLGFQLGSNCLGRGLMMDLCPEQFVTRIIRTCPRTSLLKNNLENAVGLFDKFRGNTDRRKFAKLIAERLKQAGDTREIEIDHEHFRIVFKSESNEQGVLNLANLFAEFSNVVPEDREKCLTEMVRAALSHLKQMPDEFADASYDIRPRLWTRSTFEQLRIRNLINKGKEIDWPLEPIGEHLYLSLVYDLPESVRSLSQEDLDKWNVTFWEAREKAIENLRETEFIYASVGGELYASNTNDSYDATRLIIGELVDDLDIKGFPIAMVPNRETLLITGSESEVGQKMMLEFAFMQMTEQPRPMIATPLRLTSQGEWVDWFPEHDHPLFDEYKKIRLGWLESEYEVQRTLLKELLTRQDDSDFVASYNVLSQKDHLASYCVWSKGVPSLLPETDLIVFFDPDNPQTSYFCESRLAREKLDSLMEEQSFYPARFRVAVFPSETQLKSIPVQAVKKNMLDET